LLDPEFVSIQAKRYGGVAISALSAKTLQPLILKMQDHVEALLKQDLFPKLPPAAAEHPESEAPS
jgi:hypothetical protein